MDFLLKYLDICDILLINKYNKKKYNLVTGDVGMQHSDWYKLQEIE